MCIWFLDVGDTLQIFYLILFYHLNLSHSQARGETYVYRSGIDSCKAAGCDFVWTTLRNEGREGPWSASWLRTVGIQLHFGFNASSTIYTLT